MTVGNLVVNLTATTAKFTGPLNQAQSTVGKFTSSVKNYMSGAVVAIGAAVASWLSYETAVRAVSAATEALVAERKLDAVLQATGSNLSAQAIKDYANLRQEITNFDDDATVAGAAVLATFKAISGPEFFRAMTAAQDLSAMFGGDLQAAVLQVGKALQDPIKGMAALRKSGVSFTEEQMAQAKLLQSTGRLTEAQQLILREIESQVGGVAVATGDLFTQIGNSLGNTWEVLGMFILDAANALNSEMDIPGLIGNFNKWFDSLRDVNGTWGEMLKLITQVGESLETLSRFDDHGVFSKLIEPVLIANLETLDHLLKNISERLKEIGLIANQGGLQAVKGFQVVEGGPAAPPVIPKIFQNAQDQAMANAGIDPVGMRALQRAAAKINVGGGGGLNADLAGKILGDIKNRDMINRQSTGPGGGNAAAAERGSREAYSAILRASRRESKAIDQVAENTKQLVIEAKKPQKNDVKIVKVF